MIRHKKEANHLLGLAQEAYKDSIGAKSDVNKLIAKSLRRSSEGDSVRQINHFSQRIESVYNNQRRQRR